MANLNNFHKQRKVSTWESIGNKVRTAAEVVGAAKAIWDTGKMLYHGIQAVGPYVGLAAALV